MIREVGGDPTGALNLRSRPRYWTFTAQDKDGWRTISTIRPSAAA